MQTVTIIVGSNDITPSYKKDLLTAVSKYTGGLTVNNGRGYWYNDGNNTSETYNGTLADEQILQFHFTIETEKWESVRGTIYREIAGISYTHNVSADWVHVQAQTVTVDHFSINALLHATA